jgi:hypothetical protein
MSPTNTNHNRSLLGWLISALLIAGSLWLWTERQFVVDAIQYYQYKPTAAIRQITQEATFTDSSQFVFYATQPVVEQSESFNQHCPRKEAKSPILGCYSGGRIYIFDVTDSRLEGIKEVTAAHEMLHAEYDRLPNSEKKWLQPLLQKVYDQIADDDLKTRMEYYQKTEPGEAMNELHSIIGTEVSNVGPELTKYYDRYFSNRQSLVTLHTQIEQPFKELSKEADDLVNQLDKLGFSINNDSKTYNERVIALNQDVESFNQKAKDGGFTTQREFQAARQNLLNESNNLDSFKRQIEADIIRYKSLKAKLEAINAKSASLNQSLDSTLSDTPKI